MVQQGDNYDEDNVQASDEYEKDKRKQEEIMNMVDGPKLTTQILPTTLTQQVDIQNNPVSQGLIQQTNDILRVYSQTFQQG